MTLAPASYTQVGQATRRQDGPAKVRGEARYAADWHFPGTLHARLVVSPYAHARIVRLDPAPALARPGVVRVVTAAELPIKPGSSPSRLRNPLALDEVTFYGQPVAVVLGESEAAAEDGAAALAVQYEALPVAADLESSLKPEAPSIRKDSKHSSNVANRIEFKEGDLEAGWREAAVVIEQTYQLPMVHQGYLETQSCLAVPERGGLTLYPSVQTLFRTRREVAQALGLPMSKVKIVLPEIGGGFGGKAVLLEPLVAALALLTHRPVALSFTRAEDLAAANPAPACKIYLKLGARQDGTLCAMQARFWFNNGVYPSAPLQVVGFMLGHAYPVSNFEIEGQEVLSHRVGASSYRAPGVPQYVFALESHLDAMAQALELDPLEMRRRCQGTQASESFRQVCERLEGTPLWQNRRHKEPNEGFGLAFGQLVTCLEPAMASCRLEDDGTFALVTGVADITGVSTGLAQIAAQVLGVETEQVAVVVADSDSAPYAGDSGGSKMTYNLGAAVYRAAQEAREQILHIAAEKLESSPDDLELQTGQVSVRGTPSRSLSLPQLASATMNYEAAFTPVCGQGRVAFTDYPVGFFAHLAHVRVDPETGDVAVLNYLAVHDVGFAINPAEVEGQIHGGVTQGLGWALYEGLVYDEHGTLLSNTLMDYALQTARQVPPIQTELVFVPSEEGPFGAKGIGEPPIVPGAAAIGNAIFDAVGVRVYELPATPERVRRAIKGH